MKFPNNPLLLISSIAVHLGVDLYSLWNQRIFNRRPFQYIVGCEHWRDLVLAVKDGVLIPQSETEMVVDLAKDVERFEEGLWADLGTGSGAIAIGIGKNLRGKGRVLGTDLSEIAVETTRFNVEMYELKDKVVIRQGSWFEPLKDVEGKIDGLLSNPPYIPSEDLGGLQAEVGRHEPRLELDGEDNGIDRHSPMSTCISGRNLMPSSFEQWLLEEQKTIAKLCQ